MYVGFFRERKRDSGSTVERIVKFRLLRRRVGIFNLVLNFSKTIKIITNILIIQSTRKQLTKFRD